MSPTCNLIVMFSGFVNGVENTNYTIQGQLTDLRERGEIARLFPFLLSSFFSLCNLMKYLRKHLKTKIGDNTHYC